MTLPLPFALALALAALPAEPALPRIAVADDHQTFVLAPSGQRFMPWGFNYDRDHRGRLLEDYWEAEWVRVAADFRAMRRLGANVVRVHLQLGKFMAAADRPDAAALDRLDRLLRLAERERLYLDLTGLGCYHKQDVPVWYDRLGEAERWDVQARFWEEVAARAARSPAVFCYDLMNEPVVPGGPRKAGDWLGPAFAGSTFVQVITLDPRQRTRPAVARQWLHRLRTAIRKHDARGLITVGLVDWSLDRPGLSSGFVPGAIAAELDFVSVHLYPAKGKVDDALQTLAGFAVGRPVVIEETFPLLCSMDEFAAFMAGSRKHATGWIGFFWGQPPEALRHATAIGDILTLRWLEFFVQARSAMTKASP